MNEEQCWIDACRQNTIDSYENYRHLFPEGKFAIDAAQYIRQLTVPKMKAGIDECIKSIRLKNPNVTSRILSEQLCRKYEEGQLSKESLLESFRFNHNLLTATDAKKVFSREELNFIPCDVLSFAFDKSFKEDLVKEESSDLDESQITTSDPNSTDVFFWGVPASGKTCIIDSLLSFCRQNALKFTIKSSSCKEETQKIKSKFAMTDRVFILPDSTAHEHYGEYRFEYQNDDFQTYKISFVDLPGEILTDIEEAGNLGVRNPILEKLCEKLLGNNNKIHFFVLDSNSGDRMYNNRTEYSMLQTTISFIEDNNLFSKSSGGVTNAVFLLLSKADKFLEGSAVSTSSSNFYEFMENGSRKYVENKFNKLHTQINNLCKTNSIQYNVVPFSIGDVYFQKCCRFNGISSEKLMELIFKYGVAPEDDKWTNFWKNFWGS